MARKKQQKQEVQQAQQEELAQEAQSSSGRAIIIDDRIDPPEIAAERSITDKVGDLKSTLAAMEESINQAAGKAIAKSAPGIADALKDTLDTQTEELQQLTQLPLSQIEELPKEKRELVWQQLAKQIAEEVSVSEKMQSAADALKDTMLKAAGFAELGHEVSQTVLNSFDGLSALGIAAMNATDKILAGSKIISETSNHIIDNFYNASQGTFSALSEALKAVFDGIMTSLLTDDIEESKVLYDKLKPYIDEELNNNPDEYRNGKPLGVLIPKAARMARADGEKIPLLKAEKTAPQQIEMQFDLPTDKEETRRKHIEEAHKRRELAQREGALIAGETRLATIAEKDLGFAYFTSAVCKALPEGIENYILDDQGRINLYDLTGGDKAIQEVLQEVDGLHTAFLMWLLALASNNSDIRETNSGNALIPVYLPAILKEMGIDPRPLEWDKESKKLTRTETGTPLADLRLNKFMEFISPMNKLAAWFGDDLYAIIGFDHYIREIETAYIRTPYTFRLVEYAKLHATKHGAIQNIFHADIMTENQTAVEIANRIAMGLITRGVTREDSSTYQNGTPRKPIKDKTTHTSPDGTKTVRELTFAPETETTITGAQRKREKSFTWDCKFSTLIAECPQLEREIDAIRNSGTPNKSQRINKKLKDTFTAAIRIIMEKSDIPKYYKGLTIKTAHFETFKAPTNSTFSDRLIITHHGKNPNFAE